MKEENLDNNIAADVMVVEESIDNQKKIKETNFKTKSSLIQQSMVFWARLKGFADWPARRCSLVERETLRQKHHSQRPEHVAVSFLGLRCEKGYVDERAISEFTAESVQDNKPFTMRRYKTDRDYRAAVVEAVRIQLANEVRFSSACLENLSANCKGYPLDPDDMSPAAEVCVHCKGTHLSGPFYQCEECSEESVHWHCLPALGVPEPLEGRWICNSCCNRLGVDQGTILPFDSSSEAGDNNQPQRQQPRRSRPRPAASRSASSFSSSSSSNNAAAVAAAGFGCGGSGSGGVEESAGSAGVGKDSGNTHAASHTQSSSSGHRAKAALQSSLLSGSVSRMLDSIVQQQGGESGGRDRDKFQQASEAEADDGSRSDRCFVCSQEGELLLCDFPGCVKTYHQVCIVNSFPASMSVHLGDIGAMTQSNSTLLSFGGSWFCPRHSCVSCGSLQVTAGSIHGMDLPLQYYLDWTDNTTHNNGEETQASRNEWKPDGVINGRSTDEKVTENELDKENILTAGSSQDVEVTTAESGSYLNDHSHQQLNRDAQNSTFYPSSSTRSSKCTSTKGVHSVIRKPLRMCNSCPFSVCADCEYQILGSRQSFLTYKRTTMTSECLNCVSSNSKLALAKLLEGAWVKMVTSRLAVPFLRPLLPLSDDCGTCSSQESIGCSNGKDLDLLAVLDLIRSLKYNSLHEFNIDLNKIRNAITDKLERCAQAAVLPADPTITIQLSGQKVDARLLSNSSDFTAKYQDIIRAYDTVLDASFNYFSDKEFVLATLEQNIAAEKSPTNSGELDDEDQGVEMCSDVDDPSITKSGGIQATTGASGESDRSIPNRPVEKKTTRKRRRSSLFTAPRRRSSGSSTVRRKPPQVRVATMTKGEVDLTAASGEVEEEQLLQQQDEEDDDNDDEPLDVPKDVLHEAPNRTPADIDDVAIDTKIPLEETHNSCSDATKVRTTNNSTRNTRRKHSMNKYRLMLSMWRRECSVSCTNKKSPAERNGFCITARPLSVWIKFVTSGFINEKFRRPEDEEGENNGGNSNDPWGVTTLINDHVRADWVENRNTARSQEVVKDLLFYEDNFASYMGNELLAANMMLGLQHTQLREEVSLLEDAPVTAMKQYALSSSGSGGMRNKNDSSDHWNGLPIEDDTIVMIDRLQDITKKALNLQLRLREEYMQRQRSIQVDSLETLTVGQMGIVRELKLANDNLRWRLKQRDAVISSNSSVISQLEAGLQRAYSTVEKITKEKDSACTQVDDLKSQLVKLRRKAPEE